MRVKLDLKDMPRRKPFVFIDDEFSESIREMCEECDEITRLRAQRRKMQRAARRAVCVWCGCLRLAGLSKDKRYEACEHCYRVAHDGECRL